MTKEDRKSAAPFANKTDKQQKAKEDSDHAATIDVLEWSEAVRLRPEMYIDNTGHSGLHQLVLEMVDNGIGEVLAGHCDRIDVIINEDNSVTVIDNGRGIPTEFIEKAGKTWVELLFTTLWCGGHEMHGLGSAVVNALSQRLEVEVYRDRKIHKLTFRRDMPEGSLEIIGDTDKRGTKVTFWPDPEIFYEVNEDNEHQPVSVDWETIVTRLREIAVLHKGLRICLTDKRTGKSEELFFEDRIGVS